MSIASIYDTVAHASIIAKPDLSVSHCGTVCIINLLTPAAREWVDENVEVPSWAWMGLGFACEPRLVESLLEGATNEGLEVAN